MEEKISVIIPVYNTEHDKIINCINSCLKQTFDNEEIIIILNGCSIKYANGFINCIKKNQKFNKLKSIEIKKSKKDIILDLKSNDNKINICVYSIKTKGVSNARNYGIGLASGKYITFVDSDDTVQESFFEEAIHLMQKEKLDMVTGRN